MSKRTFALIFSLFTVAVILVVIAVYNPSSYDTPSAPAIPSPTETPAPLAQTELKFGTLSSFSIASPSGAKISYSIPITISANKNKITTVQLEISYDPDALMQIALAPGTFFPKPVSLLNQIDEKNGRISYAIGIPPNTSGIEGEGIIATLSFQAKSQFRGGADISFLPKTFVRAEGSNQSVLKQAISTQIAVPENIDN